MGTEGLTPWLVLIFVALFTLLFVGLCVLAVVTIIRDWRS
jgi:hypothetical protein